jgi:ligand-binding sensor domain-containing protein
MRLILPFVLFWSIVKPSFCQTPAYLHYTVNEGLPGNIVYCGTQDHKGLLWFGTDKGLSCFDGTGFRNYGMKDGLPDPEVIGMFEDSKDRLWLSCFRKEPCYMSQAKIMTKGKDALLQRLDTEFGFFTFFEYNAQNLWVNAWGKTSYLIQKEQVIKRSYPEPFFYFRRIQDHLFTFNYKTIAELDTNGNLISLLYEFSPQSKVIQQRSLLGVGVSGNRILLSFPDFLYIFEFQNGKFVQIGTHNMPGGVAFTDSKGRFWVCSTKIGAVCFDNTHKDFSNPIIYLKNKKVTDMFEDKQGTFWFCTTGEGIYALPVNGMKNFTLQEGFPSNNITALATDGLGNVYAGDDEGNIHTISNDKFLKTCSVGGHRMNRTRQIVPSKQGGYWVGSDIGLCYVDNNQKKTTYSNNQALKCLIEIGDTLWVGTATSISYIEKNNKKLTLLHPRRTTAFSQDSDKIIWSGGIDGVYSSQDRFTGNWGLKFPLLKSRIVDIKAGVDHTLWVATPESGLLKLNVNNGKILSVTPMNELLAQPITTSVQSLAVEPNGTVWLATNLGVYSIDKNLMLKKFDKFDGLADNDVNTILIDGNELWAGTVSGLTHTSQKKEQSDYAFETYITKLRYKIGKLNFVHQMMDSVPHQKKVLLPPDAALIEIDFAGLDYLSRGNMSYKYTITHQMPPLIYLTFQNLFSLIGQFFFANVAPNLIPSATLNFGINLPPGYYSVTCLAINAQEIESKKPDTISFQLRPYWYQTVWFHAFAFGLVLWGIIRIFKTWLAIRKLHSTVSELQLQALKSQINPHFIGNSINAIQKFFYPPDPQNASLYIATFTRLLRTTMDFSERTFIQFQEEHQYIVDYLEMTKLRFGKRFDYEISGIDTIQETTPFPTMLLQPILENAVIHGLAQEGDSLVQVHFFKDNDRICCTITDNGIGILAAQKIDKAAKENRISKGLSLINNKIDTINKLFKINASFRISDRSILEHSHTGTVATISYLPSPIISTFNPNA